jgi:F-type H+-transporting ATPase subunit b
MAAQAEHAGAAAPVTPSELHEGTEAAGHESGGLPQFQFQWWPGQIVWLLLIFVVLYVALSKILLPKVGGAIEGRSAKIAGDIADARAMKDKAEAEAQAAADEAAKARATAQKTALEAKATAAAEAAAAMAAEEAVLHEKLSAAEARIRKARDAAMGNVKTIAGDTAEAIVARLTGSAASKAELAAAAKLS